MSETNFEDVGLFSRVPFSVYESWPGLRKSRIWTLITATPRHYKWELDNPEEVETEALVFGSAVHAAVLEPDRFEAEYITGGPVNPTTGKTYGRDSKKFQEWAATCGGEPISQEAYDACLAMRQSVLVHPIAAMLLKAGEAEVSMRWRDIDTAMQMKGRVDWLVKKNVLVDLKTARSAAPGPFGRQAYILGYHVQAALYFDGLRTITGREPAAPIFIAVEKEPPYCVAVYEIEEEDLELGRAQYRFALERIKACEQANDWPGYSNELLDLHLPSWKGQEVAADAPPVETPADPDDGYLGL